MANEKKETQNVTGLDTALNRKEAEYDLVTSLLEAADYSNSDDEILEVDISRRGKFLFTVHIHPISDSDVKVAQKKAGVYKPNPTNKKLGQVKIDQDNAKLASWLIYLATTDEDQEKIWGNKQVMSKFGLMENWECIDTLLKKGEKDSLLEKVFEISDMNDDEDDESSDKSRNKKRRRRNEPREDDVVLDEAWKVLSDLIRLNGGAEVQEQKGWWF